MHRCCNHFTTGSCYVYPPLIIIIQRTVRSCCSSNDFKLFNSPDVSVISQTSLRHAEQSFFCCHKMHIHTLRITHAVRWRELLFASSCLSASQHQHMQSDGYLFLICSCFFFCFFFFCLRQFVASSRRRLL